MKITVIFKILFEEYCHDLTSIKVSYTKRKVTKICILTILNVF